MRVFVQCSVRRPQNHGINIFIAGTFLYGAEDMAGEIENLRRRATEAWCSKVS